MEMEEATPPSKESLRSRVTEMHQAKIEGRWGDVYGYFSSNYRGKVGKESFLSKPKTIYFTDFEVKEIEQVSPQEAKVKVGENFSYQGYEFKDVMTEEKWIVEGKEWFYELKIPKHPLLKE